MHVYFGRKMPNSKLVDHMNKIPIPICAWVDFK
jgi:hypothetical protein